MASRRVQLNEELARIRTRLHEIEQAESQVDRRIRSADNVDTALGKLVGFFGTQTTTGQILEDIRNAFVRCQFLQKDEC